MKTVLVIGATGNIGKEIVAELSRGGDVRIIAGSRDVERAQGQFQGNPKVEAFAHSGIPFTLLRPNQYFQNFISARNVQTVRGQGFIALPLKASRVSNIDTRDIAEIAARVALQAIGAAVGKSVRYVPVEPEKFTMPAIGAEPGSHYGGFE